MFVIYDIMKIWRKRLTDLINDEAVYRTAPATLRLLKTGVGCYTSVVLFNDKTGKPFLMHITNFWQKPIAQSHKTSLLLILKIILLNYFHQNNVEYCIVLNLLAVVLLTSFVFFSEYDTWTNLGYDFSFLLACLFLPYITIT